MAHSLDPNFRSKRLVEMRIKEKKQIQRNITAERFGPFTLTSSPMLFERPKVKGNVYKFYFFETPQKKYFLAKELAKKAVYHTILKNHFQDDDTVNHLAIFTVDQIEEILMMHNLVSTWSLNEGISGYSIHDINLNVLITLCKDRRNTEYMSGGEDELIHFMGCHVRRDLNEHRNKAAKEVARMIIDEQSFKSGKNLGHYLRIKYMYPMQQEYLKVNRLVDHYYRSIPGFDEQSEPYKEEVQRIKMKHKETLDQMYSEIIARSEITAVWKSEMALFQLVKGNFPDAIFQYHIPWLGLQSLDIYIPSLKVGVEYQGIIHYEPVEFFGGQEAFEHRIYLDNLKKEKVSTAGVKLIEWHYNEPISKALLMRKLKELGVHIS